MVHTEDLVKVFTDPKRGEVRAVDGVTLTAKLGQLGSGGVGARLKVLVDEVDLACIDMIKQKCATSV